MVSQRCLFLLIVIVLLISSCLCDNTVTENDLPDQFISPHADMPIEDIPNFNEITNAEKNIPIDDPTKFIKQDISFECNLCQVMAEEIYRQILQTNDTRMEQIGFRLDAQKKIPFSRSEYRIFQILDDICTNDLLTVPELLLDDPNPPSKIKPERSVEFNNIKDVIKIKRSCPKFAEENQDDILATFNKDEKPYKVALCVKRLGACAIAKKDEL